MQLDPEVQRLQHEVELLRLKDLQQEHHIHMLTQQLRSSQPQPHQAEIQVKAEPPASPSSVTAKWQEWRQRRSLSPERFHPPKFQAINSTPGDIFKASPPPMRQRRSVIREVPQGLPTSPAQPHSSSQPPAESHIFQGTHPARRSGFKQTHKHQGVGQLEAGPQQSHYQVSAAMRASGRVGRSKGTFGSEHRWYQPTQAAGKAAALTHAALAAAAAEQELENAHWLLKSSPAGQSKSAQRCTFGSELRWWESAEPGRSSHTAGGGAQHHQAMLSPSGFAHEHGPSQKLEGPPATQASSPDQDSALQSRSVYEVQWQENAAAGQSLLQGASAAAAASASQAKVAHGTAQNRQRSISADRGLRQTQPLVSAEQAWWVSDRNPSPDSTLQRIQQKHARIQSLAAIIKQRPTSARTHTAKSTFGSEARWWEKSSAYDDASISGRSVDQQREDSSRTPSLDRPQKMQHTSPDITAHDTHGAFRGRSTFGSKAQWWEPKGMAAPAAVAVQDTAVAQASITRPLSGLPADRALYRAYRGAADSLWGHSQECHATAPPDASPPHVSSRSSTMSPEAQSLSQLQAGQQQSSQRLHAQPWAASPHLPTRAGSRPESMGQSGVSATPSETPVRGSRSSSTPRATPTRLSRGSITPVATPMRQSRGSISPSSESRRSSVRQSQEWGGYSSAGQYSRSVSPDGWVQGGRQLNRIVSSRPELQDELRHRSAERQRLEQVVAPHPSNWAQGLRDDMRTFQRRDSRVEARALQQDFLQKAKEDLETFQHNCAVAASAHGLPGSDPLCQNSSRRSIETAPALDVQQEDGHPDSYSRHADNSATAAKGAAHRCARQWLRAAKQGQLAQASGPSRMQQALAPGGPRRLSHQSSASKAAMQLQQQQLAAQEAEQKLMAFCQTTERSNAEATIQHLQEAESHSKAASAAQIISSSAQQVQQAKLAQQQAMSNSSATVPRKLMTHNSLPSTYAAPSAPQGVAGSRILRSVSWAPQLELQEPPHDDSYDSHSPHMDAHISDGLPPAMPGLAATRPTPLLRTAGDSTVKSTSTVPSDSFQARREALTAYYKAKQAAAPLPPQQAATSAAPASVADAVSHESTSSIAPPNTHVASPSSLAGPGSSASVIRHAAEEIVGPPARRASLLMSQARSVAKADALSPGKPGLKSQLSQMMEEVAQARSEVQEVQSQLSVHSWHGLRSGSTVSSLLSSDSRSGIDTA